MPHPEFADAVVGGGIAVVVVVAAVALVDSHVVGCEC